MKCKGVDVVAVGKKLTVTGYIICNGEKLKRDELSPEEQKRLAHSWNSAAMKAAGYTPVLVKSIPNEENSL